MMQPSESPDDFRISFFKPTTESARHNRNMIVQLVLIWAVAIFGFQILLQVLGKPVPENSYYTFMSAWDNIRAGDPDHEELRSASRSALTVLGKVGIDPEDRDLLDHFISWTAFRIAGEDRQDELRQLVQEFEQTALQITDIRDDSYIREKRKLGALLADIYGMTTPDLLARIAPLEVRSTYLGPSFPDNLHDQLEGIMGFYLTHNRSALTDFKFLGFPFHYFYTAVFLLILFVGLCWIYCLRTDMFNRRYGIED